MGLLYRCGLKPGEAVKLRWQDLDPESACIIIRNQEPDRERILPLPEDLFVILRQGANTCAPEDYIFPGTRPGPHLSTRMLELVVHRATAEVGIDRRITAMSLRHTFAVHALRAGHNLREVQVWLGHHDIRTTERYLRCTPPQHPVSPSIAFPRPNRSPTMNPPNPRLATPPARQVSPVSPAMRDQGTTCPAWRDKWRHFPD